MKKIYLFLLVAFAGFAAHAQGIITTIAGNTVTQYIGDGWPATNYSLAQPSGMCVDRAGNIFVSDFADHRIRKIDTHDTLFTISGNGVPGYTGDGGAFPLAEYRNPSGICLDAAENLYICEWYNDVVRKVNRTTGIITTVCGMGLGGYAGDGAPATTAHMETPKGICVDHAGNLYVADYGNHRIRKVDAITGIISTFAGTGTSGYSGDNGAATAAKISYPNAISVDTIGNLYISDYGNNRIRKVAAGTGDITTCVGDGTMGYTGDGGPAVNAKIRRPNSVHISSHGYLYLSDAGNNVIRSVNPDGIITTIAGNGGFGFAGDNGPAVNATFNGPSAVFADDAENLYIADGEASTVRKVTPIVNAVTKLQSPVQFMVYPNPSSGVFTLQASKVAVTPGKLQVYNSVGQVIYAVNIAAQYATIDLSEQPTGIYYVSFKSESGVFSEKLMVMR
jgi:sugar lactone lactonase YvrE